MRKVIYIILIVHCTLNIENCFGQWQQEYLLYNVGYPQTSFNNARCVATNGNIVHAVWYEGGFYNDMGEIYYKRSTNGGVSWGPETRLTNNPAISRSPSVSVSGSVVHVVWSDERDGNFEIYYKRSSDAGISWSGDIRLTNNPGASEYPSMDVSGSFVHVVWQDERDQNQEIYYKRSTNGGISWGKEIRLINDIHESFLPSISVSGLYVHVAWFDRRENEEIYYNHSSDGGTTWGTNLRLTTNPAYSEFTSISVSVSVVHVVWMDFRDSNWEIYYKRSTNGGINWEADKRLTTNSSMSWYPSVSSSGSVVHVAWQEYRDYNWDIYYKRSTDGGISWGTDTRLTNNPSDTECPSVAVSGSVVHVVWGYNYEDIYYKRNPTGNSIGVININSEIPNHFSLSQNYPNPFNPKTVISFQLAVNSFAELKVYDLLGREVAFLVNENLRAGTYEVDWDATNYPSGVYYYKIVTNDFSETKKMVLVK